RTSIGAGKAGHVPAPYTHFQSQRDCVLKPRVARNELPWASLPESLRDSHLLHANSNAYKEQDLSLHSTICAKCTVGISTRKRSVEPKLYATATRRRRLCKREGTWRGMQEGPHHPCDGLARETSGCRATGMSRIPGRIVCLSAESADWLWRIGAWENVVGITAFFSAPPNCTSRPRVSGFSTGRLEEITALNPDLIITFSDVQASLTAELIKRGLPVFGTNQRMLAEIETTLVLLGRAVGREAEAERLLIDFRE